MEVRTVEGDLLDQPTEGIVNAWNRNIIPWWLLLPQGVSGAIKRCGGYRPFHEIWITGPLPLGQARSTSAGRLPYKAIVHVAGINMLWQATPSSIQNSVRNAIAEAERLGLKSLAFPVIGTGSGSFHPEQAEQLMREAFAALNSDVEAVLVRFKPAKRG
jgi:O-acetyl-ADP-ribose deacetylase (regulator of RNase III)